MQASKASQMLDKLMSLSSSQVSEYGASCLFNSSSPSHLKFSFHIFPVSVSSSDCLRPGYPGLSILSFRKRCLANLFLSPRHVLQPRKYVSNATARSRVCELTILRLKVLTSREGGVATVWYGLTIPIKPQSQH